MQTIDGDRAFLENSLPELQDFLLSNDLYWPAGTARGAHAGANMPRFSLGNLRLAAARLGAASGDLHDGDLIAGVEGVFTKWRSNWARKAALEYSSRLRLWEDRLNELISDPSEAIYRYEIRIRVILELLRGDLLVEPPRQEMALLEGLDTRHRAASMETGFIWDTELQKAFPPEPYWFLYRTIRSHR